MMLPLLLQLSLIASSALAASWIAPGAVWYDTSGNRIDAHGPGIYKRGDTFYWIGHSAPDNTNVTPKLYSSTDLVNWAFVGQVASSVGGVWRPKLAKPNGSFWIYGQQDRNVLALKSSNLNSGYTQASKTTLPPNGYTYSDTGMFFDEDANTYYLLTSADHNTVQINRIESDGRVGEQQSTLKKGAYEAPGIFKEGGIYFLIVSGKTGYRSNPNKVFWATSLAGPWNGGTDIAPAAQNTYNSQNSHELTIKGSQKTTHIYIGDSWATNGYSGSNYVWLPINVNVGARTATLDYHAMWKVDVKTGVVSYPTTKKRYAPAYPSLSGRAPRATSDVTFRNVEGTGNLQWLKLNYRVNNPAAGEAYIIVNDQPPINVSSLNTRAGYHSSVPIQLELKPSDTNEITLGTYGEGLEIQVDDLEIFEEDFS